MFEEIVKEEEEVVEEEVEETESDTTEEAEQESEEIDWEARAKKAEALIVKNKKEIKPKEEDVKSPDSERLDRIELKQDGYTEDVIDKIMELGGKKALENPIIKKSADELQAEFKKQQALDIEDGPQGTFKTKYSKEDLKKMSVEEMEKILPHAEE